METHETTMGQKLKAIREKLSISQAELANLIGTTVVTISRAENDLTILNQKNIHNLVERTGVNFDWFMHHLGEMGEISKRDKKQIDAIDPWKDALVSQIASERDSLKKEVERLWQMLSHYTTGAKPNFLKATDAANMFLFPNQTQLVKVRAKA